MLRKASVAVAIGLAVLLTALPGHGDDPKKDPPNKKIAELMHRKLESSQKVLEGIATNDFTKIARNAEELMQISKEAEWKVLKTERYELYSNEFRRNAETLAKNAKDKNLDAAALTYVELTLTCVRCHKHVRETRETSFERWPTGE